MGNARSLDNMNLAESLTGLGACGIDVERGDLLDPFPMPRIESVPFRLSSRESRDRGIGGWFQSRGQTEAGARYKVAQI